MIAARGMEARNPGKSRVTLRLPLPRGPLCLRRRSSYAKLLIGQPKPLHPAGSYKQLRYQL